MSEWSNVSLSKSDKVKSLRGFESLSLRQKQEIRDLQTEFVHNVIVRTLYPYSGPRHYVPPEDWSYFLNSRDLVTTCHPRIDVAWLLNTNPSLCVKLKEIL